VEDWADIQRLFHRECMTRKAIARRLGMSRTTVIRLLALSEPPQYAGGGRARTGSISCVSSRHWLKAADTHDA